MVRFNKGKSTIGNECELTDKWKLNENREKKGLNPLNFKLEATDEGTFKISDDTVNYIFVHSQSEYDRITEARQDLANLKDLRKNDKTEEADSVEASMVENYHYVWNNDGTKDFSRGNAYDFVMFKGLNYSKFNEVEVKETLKKHINGLVTEELKYAYKIGVIGWMSNQKQSK